MWQQRQPAEVQRLDVRVSVGSDLRRVELVVRRELLARLLEHERVRWLVRLVVQPEVHGVVDVHDDRRPERERRLLGRRDLSHHVRGRLLGQLLRRLDVHARVPRRRGDVDRRVGRLLS